MHLENLNSEVLEEGVKAMEHALKPRIHPMVFEGEPLAVNKVPHFKRTMDGERGMVFSDEFINGAIPEDLEYVPGHVKPGEVFDGSNFNVLVYDDPALNLPYEQWRLLQQALTPPAIVQPEVTALSAIQPHIDDEDNQPVVISTPEGLLLQTKFEIVKITNFGLWVTEKRILMGDRKEVGSEITLRIECLGNTFFLDLNVIDIDMAVKKIQRKHPECAMRIDTKRVLSHMTNYIRKQLACSQEVVVYQNPGFTLVRNQWIYVHDGIKNLANGVRFQCGKSIGFLADLDACTAFQHALGVLMLSARMELMLPLLLLMHLGPLFNLFRAADCTPRFLTFLAGATGSLKTSMALGIFNLFDGVLQKPAANFFDTEAALERKLGNAYSQVFVLDDFSPAVTSLNAKQKLSRLELVIRFVGDSISKSRCKPNMDAAEEFHPVGCCLVTGECTGGSRSSLLRCLVLPISKGDISGERLSVYQKNPLLLQTHMQHFLTWAGAHGDDIIQFIQSCFPEERHAFMACVRERRLVDTGATLMLVARILLQYGVALGVFTEEQANATAVEWRRAIDHALQASEASTQELDPLAMYLTALFSLRDAGKLPLAVGQENYVPSDHIGFINGDSWWLRPEDAFKCVVKYWRGFDQIFPLRDNDVRKLLSEQHLIEVESGTRGIGRRITYVRKTSLPGRIRMLVLKAADARAFLDRELES